MRKYVVTAVRTTTYEVIAENEDMSVDGYFARPYNRRPMRLRGLLVVFKRH